MQNQNKTVTRTAVLVAALMVFAFVLRMIYEDLDNAMLQAIMSTARNTIHISLLFSWVVSLSAMPVFTFSIENVMRK